MAPMTIHKENKNRFVGDVVGVGGSKHDTQEDKGCHLVRHTIKPQHDLSRVFFVVWVLSWFCVHTRQGK